MGVLNGIFILYPILLAFLQGIEGTQQSSFVSRLDYYRNCCLGFKSGILLDLRRGILTSFGTYLMYLTGHIYIIIGTSAMSGDHSFLV